MQKKVLIVDKNQTIQRHEKQTEKNYSVTVARAQLCEMQKRKGTKFNEMVYCVISTNV